MRRSATSDRVGIAKFILRDAQHLAAVEVIEQAIVLSIMRFADELVDVSQFDLPAAKDVRAPELEMAKALVNSLAAEWDPSKYTDQYRENLMRIVKSKIEGAEPELEADETPRRGEVVDLMERLRRSLAHAGGTRKGVSAPKGGRKKAPKKATARKRSRHAA